MEQNASIGFFPQEMDDEFLVISDTLSGNIKWKKVNVTELQKIMIEKIDDGFTFPLNPKVRSFCCKYYTMHPTANMYHEY